VSLVQVCVQNVGNDMIVSLVQDEVGVTKPSGVMGGTSEHTPSEFGNHKMKIVAFEDVQPRHTFKENNNCQIINLVINSADSKFSVVEIFKNLGPVPFLSS